MDFMELLIALAESKGFAVKLKGVALDDCEVFVHPTPIAGDEPTAAEKAARKAYGRWDTSLGKTLGQQLQNEEKKINISRKYFKH